MATFTDLRMADPFLRPSWRHERVMQMFRSSPPDRCTRFDDPWIKTYRSFIALWRHNSAKREALQFEQPGLYYAYKIFDRINSSPEVGLILEARLLAAESYESIADGLKTIPSAIEWYEKLFFNVQPFLQHRDWILAQVLLPASVRFATARDDSDDKPRPLMRAGDEVKLPLTSLTLVSPFLDMSLKFFSYFGGPIVCDVLLTGFRSDRRVQSRDDLSDFFDDQFRLQIQRRSAQAAGVFDINRYNVMELFQVHTNLIAATKAKNPETQRSEFEKHVLAFMSELPWAAGSAGKKLFDKTLMGQMDEGATEMDDEEMLLTNSGSPPDSLAEVAALTIASREPIPPKRPGDKNG